VPRYSHLALLAATLAAACLATAAPRTFTVDAGSPEAQREQSRLREVEQTVQAWKLAWELGDADTYLRFYHPAFAGDADSRLRWEGYRRTRLANRRITLQMQDVRIRLLGPTEAEVRFVQHYSSREHADSGDKRIVLRREAGAWLILQEQWTQRAAAGRHL
jgi:ketosteroid isomerase-like protein